jgi:NAD(P)-dependent dehydrogenase (short-subunit alcohol dehydrogenase family)
MDAAARKVCVVTGSSSGIGAATARLYAKNGWNVAINCSREVAPRRRSPPSCRAAGAEAIVVKADVALDADMPPPRRRGRREARPRRRAVNNAGTTKVVLAKDLDGLDAAEFHRSTASTSSARSRWRGR